MDEDDERVLAAFEKHDEFVRIQNSLLTCDLFEEPTKEQNSTEIGQLRRLTGIVRVYAISIIRLRC